MTFRLALAVTFCAALHYAAPAAALTSVPIASGLADPLFLTSPVGDTRLFVAEKAGVIKVIQGGVATPWLDLSGLVDASGERGLLGLAFDPGFASNGRLYVNYIDNTTKNTVVARYTVATPATGAPDPGSATTILTVTQPAGRDNHKAGWIGFRPGDPGNLYIATGDGGSSNDPDGFAQSLSSNLGKILRVAPGDTGGYTIPTGNPFAGVVPGNDEIWAYGLRNPFRASFDRTTGDFWIGDVGQNAREEVNLQLAGAAGGANYGWRAREGSIDNSAVADPAPPGAIEPLFDYAHATGNQTVIGGYVYRGGAEPGLDGVYFYGDFVSGRIFSGRLAGGSFIDVVDRTAELGNLFGGFELTSFGEDGFGALYVMGRDGNLFRIAAAVPEPSTVAMLFAGLAILVIIARRRVGASAPTGQ